jgi:hypothetical protein
MDLPYNFIKYAQNKSFSLFDNYPYTEINQIVILIKPTQFNSLYESILEVISIIFNSETFEIDIFI